MEGPLRCNRRGSVSVASGVCQEDLRTPSVEVQSTRNTLELTYYRRSLCSGCDSVTTASSCFDPSTSFSFFTCVCVECSCSVRVHTQTGRVTSTSFLVHQK